MIEQNFARLKTWLRSTQARTLAALWSAIGSLLDRFALDEGERCIGCCGNWGNCEEEDCPLAAKDARPQRNLLLN
jgi:hypothetical protein